MAAIIDNLILNIKSQQNEIKILKLKSQQNEIIKQLKLKISQSNKGNLAEAYYKQLLHNHIHFIPT